MNLPFTGLLTTEVLLCTVSCIKFLPSQGEGKGRDCPQVNVSSYVAPMLAIVASLYVDHI